MANVCGIVLAAGRSARLGRAKQLLLLNDAPIIQIVTETAFVAGLTDVILVTGAEANAVAAAADPRVRAVHNPDHQLGQSTSLRTGVAAIGPSADAFIVILGDQPEVGADVITAVISEFEATNATIVQPVYGGIPGNPVLFRRDLAPDLMQITGDEGARSLIKRMADHVRRVRVSDEGPPADIDTEADYQALLKRAGRPE